MYAAELYGVVAAAIQDDSQFGDSLRLMHQLATSKVRWIGIPAGAGGL